MAARERDTEKWLDPKSWLWVLGINAWGALLAVPAWHLGLWRQASLILPLLLPLVIFIVSITRQSQVGLLFLFPASLLLPTTLAPRLTGVDVYVTSTFLITVLSLSAYLLGAAAATRGGGVPPRVVEVRGLGQKEVPGRWRRRMRIITFLAVSSVVLPTLLLALNDGTPSPNLPVEEPLPPLVVNAAAFLLGVGITFAYLLSPLLSFLRGDSPPYLRPQRNPLRTFGFWVTVLFAAALIYFYYKLKG